MFSYSRSRALIFCLICLLLSTGCSMTQFGSSGDINPTSEADIAYNSKNYVSAVQLYEAEIASGNNVPLVWQRLGISSFKIGKFERASTAMKTWAQLDNSAVTEWDYAYITAKIILKNKGKSAYIDYAKKLSNLANANQKSLANSIVLIAGSKLEDADSNKKQILDDLQTKYQASLDSIFKKQLEIALRGYFENVPMSSFADIEKSISLTNMYTMPRNIILWSKYMKQGAYSKAQEILGKSSLQSADDLKEELGKVSQSTSKDGNQIVLLLPLTGPYQSVGWRVTQGANAAQAALEAKGITVKVNIINSEEADWFQKLEQLAPNTLIVGGPIRTDIWERIKNSELVTSTVFLTFLNKIDGEGSIGWRFFSSEKDQIASIINNLNTQKIKNIAIIHPTTSVSDSLVTEFQTQGQSKGLKVKVFSYTSGSESVWSAEVTKILGVTGNTTQSAGKNLFDGVFVTGSMSSGEKIIALMSNQNEKPLQYMAPRLWSQIAQARNGTTFGQRIMTVDAWWPGMASNIVNTELSSNLGKTGGGTPEFWRVLGFDFVNFAVDLTQGFEGQLAPSNMNSRLSTAASKMNWAEAPISWNENGIATQSLIPLMITSSGLKSLKDNNYEN